MNEQTQHTSAEWSRRQFLEAAGFTVSVATLSGCGRAPVTNALPFDYQPEGFIPGQRQEFASTCSGCAAGCGVSIQVLDGRPLKMEGLQQHPLSQGGLCAIGQASVLPLYDSQRLQQPLSGGKETGWDEVDGAIIRKLEEINRIGGKVRVVTGTITSPSLAATLAGFLQRFKDGQHITLDAISSSAIIDAHQSTHDSAVLPHYKLGEARVIASFGADFLGTWISPVEFTAAWQQRRAPTEVAPQMSYHVQFEGRMSLTGANADRRFRLAPFEFGSVLNHLAILLASRAGVDAPPGRAASSALSQRELKDLADRLWHARGSCLVLCDSQDIEEQKLVNWINHTLGNYGKTIDIQRPSRQRQGRDADLRQLIEELQKGDVAALFVSGTDLTHNLPNRDQLAAAISRVPLIVSCTGQLDDFAALAHFVCPDHHALESWSDAEPIRGLFTVSQPTLRPFGNTRSVLESFAKWSGSPANAVDIVKSTWQRQILPRKNSTSFRKLWDQVLHDGFVEVAAGQSDHLKLQSGTVALVSNANTGSDFTLSLYHKVGLTDSVHAHNPWLQELPDPTTKVTWDNYVCMSPNTASRLGVSNGDVVRMERSESGARVELPVVIQAGQHDQVLAAALAYGVVGTDRFSGIGPQWLEARPTVKPGERIGENVAGFIDVDGGIPHYHMDGITLHVTGERRDIAATQQYHKLEMPRNVAPRGGEVRDIVQSTTLAEFSQDSRAGEAQHLHHSDKQLWAEDHPKTGHQWGLAIDLNKCTGCSACLIACQSENNVSVVGKDEVKRRREMHWIRIDRYFSGPADDIRVVHQPMMCQHCDNAPCETVCPVLATVHGAEGLNEQAYNRCVGTRYCANNCPYKVRRFNWFTYQHEDERGNLVLNPDVTVRSRGVMEKCSMCVQRIEEGKLAARQRGEPLADGDIRTACQQSCPAQAIVFGDMNSADSAITAAMKNPRNYRVLDEFNFRTSVSYQRVVSNRGAPTKKGESHG